MTKREIYSNRNELSKKLVKVQMLLLDCYELSDAKIYKAMCDQVKEMAKINYEMMARMKTEVEEEIANEQD